MTDAPPEKKAKIEMTPEEKDAEFKEVLAAMDKVQTEIDNLNEKASDEILKIEQKYNTLRKPEYDQRTQQISKIEGFWPRAILNHPQLGPLIDEAEEGAIQHLIGLEVEEYEDIKSGFHFKFTFSPNEFFDTEVVEKQFYLTADTPYTKSTEIRWKAGKNIVEKILADRKKRGSAPDEMPSFFQWLAETGDPTVDEFAEAIKDDLWPNPLQYFLSPDMEDGDIEDDEEGDEE